MTNSLIEFWQGIRAICCFIGVLLWTARRRKRKKTKPVWEKSTLFSLSWHDLRFTKRLAVCGITDTTRKEHVSFWIVLVNCHSTVRSLLRIRSQNHPTTAYQTTQKEHDETFDGIVLVNCPSTVRSLLRIRSHLTTVAKHGLVNVHRPCLRLQSIEQLKKNTSQGNTKLHITESESAVNSTAKNQKYPVAVGEQR